MIDRSKYLCPIPFRFSEITNDGQFLCCPGWLPIDVKKTDNYLTNFNSKLSQEIRESMEKYKQINSVEFSNGEDNENF